MADPQDAQLPWNADTRIACAFSFQCPKTWERLESTADPTVRHCSTCDREVHLALTEADFRRYHEQGACVAVPVVSSDKIGPSTESYIVGGTNSAPYRTQHLKPV
jgi:hypothetical protein